jgi:hypothetical protein
VSGRLGATEQNHLVAYGLSHGNLSGLKCTGKTGQRSKMYPTLKTGCASHFLFEANQSLTQPQRIGASSRDPIVELVRSERAVWDYPILIILMAALVKSFALQNACRRNCKRMLRQQ